MMGLEMNKKQTGLIIILFLIGTAYLIYATSIKKINYEVAYGQLINDGNGIIYHVNGIRKEKDTNIYKLDLKRKKISKVVKHNWLWGDVIKVGDEIIIQGYGVVEVVDLKTGEIKNILMDLYRGRALMEPLSNDKLLLVEGSPNEFTVKLGRLKYLALKLDIDKLELHKKLKETGLLDERGRSIEGFNYRDTEKVRGHLTEQLKPYAKEISKIILQTRMSPAKTAEIINLKTGESEGTFPIAFENIQDGMFIGSRRGDLFFKQILGDNKYLFIAPYYLDGEKYSTGTAFLKFNLLERRFAVVEKFNNFDKYWVGLVKDIYLSKFVIVLESTGNTSLGELGSEKRRTWIKLFDLDTNQEVWSRELKKGRKTPKIMVAGKKIVIIGGDVESVFGNVKKVNSVEIIEPFKRRHKYAKLRTREGENYAIWKNHLYILGGMHKNKYVKKIGKIKL